VRSAPLLVTPSEGCSRLLGVHLSQAGVRRIAETAAYGVYMPDIDVRPIVKPAARIGSGIGVPDCPRASGEQHRQTNDSQSTFEVIHLSLSVTLMVFDRGRGEPSAKSGGWVDADRPLTLTGDPRNTLRSAKQHLRDVKLSRVNPGKFW
jgi:hypothetical protein